MVELFGKKELGIPNFHAVLHAFQFARIHGPPILYWTRPFEHKHAEFKGYMANSNHVKVERFSMEKEMTILVVKYLFPFVELLSAQERCREWPSKLMAQSDL